MELEYSIQKLYPLKKLNAFSKKVEREVLFLRYEKSFYLEYHPWKEFGDKDIEELLSEIKCTNKLPTFLNQQLEVEKERKNFQLEGFKNHSLNEDAKVSKLKYLGDLNDLIIRINKSSSEKIRIDFNNQLNYSQASLFLTKLGKNTHKIDYLEDPYPIDKSWVDLGRKFNISLAQDRNCDETIDTFHILKPNVDEVNKYEKDAIFSSYMGSDLGRIHCYLLLLKYGNLELYHGINTPMLYKDQVDIFFEVGDQYFLPHLQNIEKVYENLASLNWSSL